MKIGVNMTLSSRIIPVRVTTRYQGSPDGAIPASMRDIADPFVALARASALTTTGSGCDGRDQWPGEAVAACRRLERQNARVAGPGSGSR